MLKLTRYSPKVSVYIAPAHIIAIIPEEAYTKLEFVGGSHFFVIETAEAIMKMDAMLYHLHPPFVIQGSTKVA